jgi:hypothetical protein
VIGTVTGQLFSDGWKFHEISEFNISGVLVCLPIENQHLWTLRYGERKKKAGTGLREREGQGWREGLDWRVDKRARRMDKRDRGLDKRAGLEEEGASTRMEEQEICS